MRSASTRAAGVFLGATIHDVAQVVGAGYSMSRETGDIATFVKLMRVAMLLPVIVFAVMLTRARAARQQPGPSGPPLLPWFAVAFAVLVAINSTGWLPDGRGQDRQRVLALVPGRGDRRHRHEDATEGAGHASASKPVLLMLGETVFLAAARARAAALGHHEVGSR